MPKHVRTFTATHASATAGSASGTALASPAAGLVRTYLLIQNSAGPGGETIWIRLDGGTAAASAPSLRLAPGDSYSASEHVPQSEITCIRGGVADVTFAVVYEEMAT